MRSGLTPARITNMTPAIPPLENEPETIAQEAFSIVQALPIEAHAAVGILLIVGLGLWLFGGKIIKPMFGIAGLVLGGLVGLIALPAFGVESIGGAPGPLIGMAIGAVIGFVITLMMLKAAIVFAAGLGFAAVGFLGGTVYLSHNPLPDENPPAFVIDDSERAPDGRLLIKNQYTDEMMTLYRQTETLREADSFLRGSKETAPEAADSLNVDGDQSEPADEHLRAIVVRCDAIVREGADMAKSHWNALSQRERLVVVGSTLGSLALGLLIGFMMPKKATAFITALAGSAIWLTAGALLIEALLPAMRGLTDQPPTVWAGVWAFVFLVGLVVQLAGLGKVTPSKKRRKKKAEAEEDEGEEEDDEG